jgi:hypothetical protein
MARRSSRARARADADLEPGAHPPRDFAPDSGDDFRAWNVHVEQRHFTGIQ